MSVFVVRIPSNGTFLQKPGLFASAAGFKKAHRFATKEEALAEAEKFSSWRQVLEVCWRLVWHQHDKREPMGTTCEGMRFDSPGEARDSVDPWLLYGIDGLGDTTGYKVVRCIRVVRA